MRLLKNETYMQNVLPVLKTINSGSTMVEGFINTAIHFAKTMDELTPYMEKFENYLITRKSLGGLLFPYESNKNFYTAVHTDLWSNNIMIRKHKNQRSEIKFLDLQLIELGSPVRDLLFFIFTSVQLNLIKNFFEKFINLYYNEFNYTLLQFGCDLQNYSFKTFQREIDHVAPHELFHIIFMLKPIFSEKGSVESLDSIKADDFGRIDNVGNAYSERLKLIVLLFEKNNWL